MPVPALLPRAILTGQPPHPNSRLSRHTTPFTIATSGPLTPMVEFRKAPQLMAEDDNLELVATALPGTAVAAGRRFSTLALARLYGATSWASAAEALDLSCPGPRASRAG